MKKGISPVLLAVFLFIFAMPMHTGVSGSNAYAETVSQIALTKEVALLSIPGTVKGMLQFKSGGHVLGFQPNKAYLATLDHALSVEFLGTKGVMPKADGNASVASTMQKAPPLSKVVYQNLWEGISLTYESTEDGLTESTYHVAPGAKVSSIRLRYSVPVEAQKDGSLKFKFVTGCLTESAPVAWQEIEGKRVPVSVAFRVLGGEVGFSASKYDATHPLTIDPTYAWHTFYGSASGNDQAYGIAVDGSGNVYVTGNSTASWLGDGTTSPIHAYSGNNNIFVLKLDSSGAYQWHTFYGTNSGDSYGYGIAVDGSGNVYVTGNSTASWLGDDNTNPVHAYSGSNDVFVLKFNATGAYQWHTFYGSVSGAVTGNSIAVDGSSNVYVTGNSAASWQGDGSANPLNAYSGINDIFVLKLSASGAYQWHTFYGSVSGADFSFGIAVGGNNVYVSGLSTASWQGDDNTNPVHAYSGSNDIFVLKLNANGTYQWHTFYGSASGNDQGNGIAVDGSGNVYVTGNSAASWQGDGSANPLNAHSGINDIFVLKLGASGAYQWHTFYGSASGDDFSFGIAVGGNNVYVTGYSAAAWQGDGNTNPVHAYSGSYDIFVLKLNANGTYQWHTFYGSNSNDDFSNGIAVDGSGNIYVTGYSAASWQGDGDANPLEAYSGSNDIFVLKMTESSLYGSFAGAGIWKWDGTAWSQVTPNVPTDMAASGSLLYGNFGTGAGIWKWDGTAWSQVTPNVPTDMAASGSLLYGNFGTGAGIWKWDGTTWSQVTPNAPTDMAASGSLLYGNFGTGAGIWKWDGTAWSQVTPNVPTDTAASGSLLYGNFGTGAGIWKWDGTAWSQVTPNVPTDMAASGSLLYGNFGTGAGIWKWDSTTWSQVTPNAPTDMAASGSLLYGNFGTGAGIWKWDGTTWSQVTPNAPTDMVAGF